MGLVDYSDSESEPDSETTVKPAPKNATTVTTKAPVQKVVDRSNPRKILVNLPSATHRDEANTTANNGDKPPAKRARTGGGAFSGFSALLPPPKNTGKPTAISTSSSSSGSSSSSVKNAPRPVFSLKTGAAPGFSRADGAGGEDTDGGDASRAQQQPSIPAGQKPADEVKLVGKPLMFKPLSVSRKPGKKNTPKLAAVAPKTTVEKLTTASPAVPEPQAKVGEAPKKKVSLFSTYKEPSITEDTRPGNGDYEPMFQSEQDSTNEFAQYDAQFAESYGQDSTGTGNATLPNTNNSSNSLTDIAAEMNLSAAARRELFGRRGGPTPSQSATKVINFNTDQEYRHNEELRASGEQQIHNPVRAIAPGKHSLRQLVNQVQNQREALEESFAKGKSNRNEAGSRYGWR